MPAQTFTLTNTGTATSQLDKIVFNTPVGLSHAADLTNFGGPANFTGTSFTVTNPSLSPNQTRTFTLDYLYVSGTAGTRNGSVTVFYIGGQSCAAQTSITVGQAPPAPPAPAPVSTTPTYSITTNKQSVAEGSTVTFTINTTNISNGTTLWWAAIASGGASPPDAAAPSPPQGSFTVNNNVGTVSITIANDNISPETGEGFTIRLYPSEADRNQYGTGLAQSPLVTIINSPYPTSIVITQQNIAQVAGETKSYRVNGQSILDPNARFTIGTTLYWRILSSGNVPSPLADPTRRLPLTEFDSTSGTFQIDQALTTSNFGTLGITIKSTVQLEGRVWWYVFEVSDRSDFTGLKTTHYSWVNP